MLAVSRAQARAFQVAHSLLDPGRAGTLEVPSVVRQLGAVQVDPMQVVAPNHELVLGARAADFRLGQLAELLYGERTLVEAVSVVRCIIPVEHLRYFRPLLVENARRYAARARPLVPLMERIKLMLQQQGPLTSLEIDDDERVDGWWDADGSGSTRAARQALEWLWHFGQVAVVGRRGAARQFDLFERAFPELDTGVELEQSRRFLADLYFRSVGLFSPSDPHFGFMRTPAAEKRRLLEAAQRAGTLLAVQVGDCAGPYYLHRQWRPRLEAARPAAPERAVLLPPLDNLLWDRQRLLDLWEMHYRWEAYVPAARRAFGPYTMPVLLGDRLVARVDLKADRKNGLLMVRGTWWEPGAGDSDQHRQALDRALQRLAALVLPGAGAEVRQVGPS